MNTRKQEQLKIAAILYDLGLDMDEVVATLNKEGA